MSVASNTPYDQYTATSGQTVFNYTFEIVENTDLLVYQRASTDDPNDVTDILALTTDYTVTGVGAANGGTIVLTSGATLGDIVTIKQNVPVQRDTDFTPGGVLRADDLNSEFDNQTLIEQLSRFNEQQRMLSYWNSAEVSLYIDTIIPVLGANQIWAKNNDNTAIIPYDVPSSGSLAPGAAKYLIQQADADLPNAQVMGALASGFVVNTTTSGVQLSRILLGTAYQIAITNGDGISADPVFSIVDDVVLPGTAGMGIPAGTTAQRVIPSAPSIGLRFNTDLGELEAYIGGSWVAIPSAAAGLFLPLAGGAMAGDIDMGGNVINGLTLPLNDDEAASKLYVDTVVGGAAGGSPTNVQYNNGGAFAGDPNFTTDGAGNVGIVGSLDVDNININGNRISASSGNVELEDAQLFNAMDANSQLIHNVATPLAGSDAANRAFVEATAAGKYFVAPVRVSATSNFSATYANGVAGVGATLTATANGAAALDGVSLAVNDRVIFPFQSSTLENGLYFVSNAGSAGTQAVYTRATDYDQPSEIDPGDTVGVTEGTTYAGAFFMESSIVTTIGTDPITFIVSVNPNVVTLNTTQTITGDKTFTGTTTLDNFVFDTNQMQHASDLDNYFEFGTDTQNFVTGNSSRMDISNSGVRLGAANSRVTTILDEDTMVSDSDTALATQQSIKAFVNSYAGGGHICKNLIIGGDFGTNPWQRGTSFPTTAYPFTTGQYFPDRWATSFISTAVATIAQSSDVPTLAQAGILTTASLLQTITTADTSIAAGDIYYINQRIEGYNFSRLAQNPFTLSFWVKASVTGTYCCFFANSGADRSYVAEYTVNAANTWEFKTITVSASPSAGTWDYSNGIGLYVGFTLACGSTFQTTPDTWQTGSFRGTSNQVNALATVGNKFQLALIQLESGSVATPFEIRTEQQELALCQRYFFKTFPQGTAPSTAAGTSNGGAGYRATATGGTTTGAPLPYPVTMRATPTVTFYNPVSANAKWYNISASSDSGTATSVVAGDRGLYCNNVQVAGDSIGQFITVNATANAEL